MISVVLAAIFLRSDLKCHVIPNRWAVVKPGYIYRSACLSPYLVCTMLQQYRIDVVIGLARPSPRDPTYQAEMAVVGELGLAYHHFKLAGDGTGGIEQYIRVLTTLVEAKRAQQRVWVHC